VISYKKGEITAFLSIVFVLLVSFIFAMLESAVIQTSKNEYRLLADLAIYSVFGEYQKDLFDDYRIFALEGTYEKGSFAEEEIIHRMRYFGAMGMEHEITDMQLLTDNYGKAFREQVHSHMMTAVGGDIMSTLTGMSSDWSQQLIVGEAAEQAQGEIFSDLVDALDENETSLPDADNPLGFMDRFLKAPLLTIATSKEFTISNQRINLEEQVSKRTLRQGRGSLPGQDNLDDIQNKAIFKAYILRNFSYATAKKDYESGDMEDLSPQEMGGDVSEDEKQNPETRKRNLSYEVEYILEGKNSDEQNLQAVATKILLIRVGMNYGYLLKDSPKRAAVKAASAAISAVGGVTAPALLIAIEHAILITWAFAESVMDIRALLDGNKVAFVKSSNTWKLSLQSLIKWAEKGDVGAIAGESDEEAGKGKDDPGGLSYREYLFGFLMAQNINQQTMRSIDRVEQNLIFEKGKNFFRADNCISKIRLQNIATIRGDITYDFPLYFGYN